MSRRTQFHILATILSLVICGCASSPTTPVAKPEPAPISDAEAAFEAGSKRPPTPTTLYAFGQILATQGRDEQAQGVFERIVDKNPEYLPAYCDLAELHMRHDRIEQASVVLKTALQRFPNEAVLINDLGMCQMMKGRYPEALAAFNKASTLSPAESKYRANIAMVLGLLGKYEESLSVYCQVMSPSDAHYNLAVLCDARHDPSRAQIEYQASAALAKNTAPAARPTLQRQ